MQILCDFAGYSDIAKGIAKCFNVDLMTNFNHPYRSESFKEFWGRWHISLSSWLKDYIYIPLGGSRVKIPRWIFNIFIVFLVSGLWHGASWTYVIWGMLHFLVRVIEHFLAIAKQKFCEKKGIDYNRKLFRYIRIGRTFILVSLFWIFFRSNSIGDAFDAYRILFTKWNFSSEYFNTFTHYIPMSAFTIITIIGAVILFNTIDYLPKSNFITGIKGSLIRKSSYVVLSLVVMAAFIYLQSINIESSFIYFQF